jgi:hypothetical protein
MSIRTSLLAVASIAALATTALAPTSASAFWGGFHFRASIGHFHYGFVYPRPLPGLPYIPACGHVGCNMKW